ncbi:MAG: CRISPR-associated helicase Cas3' [Bacillota bacterium]
MIYAKSNPIESLGEHTTNLIENYQILREGYNHKLADDLLWELLEIAVCYHDAGKIYSQFQNRITSNINQQYDKEIAKVESEFEEYIQHNFLSPAFLPYRDLKYKKEILQVLIQAIGFHHERNEEPNKELIKRIINEELEEKVKSLREELEVEINNHLSSGYIEELESKSRIKEDHEYYQLYLLLKGLLHRLDHSASAYEPVEVDIEQNVGQYTKEYMQRFPSLREVQKFSRDNQNQNLIIVASTGMGKTESALLWIGDDKAYFTLPLRVSINALYDRVRKGDSGEDSEAGIGYDAVGLLHSTSIDYLEEADYKDGEEVYSQSRLLAKKLTFSTIDQIFKFPLKYRGYEKSYATLAYSKVVLDEVQAYDPHIAAVLLKGLEMIDQLGGKFMIMTATLPKLYTEYLTKKGIINGKKSNYGEFLSTTVRHKIEVKEEALISDVEEMIERGKDNKVLVIVNTVKRAIEIFTELDYLAKEIEVNLLHSMFIKRDRSKLESEIKKFARDQDASGIWITTQLVEASLDIDFDYLFTELSTLDSLFQRLGRCYRQREFNLAEPNCYIYTADVTGVGAIYDQEIWKQSKERLTDYNLELLTEEDKVRLVEELYSRENLAGSQFLNDFDLALEQLSSIEPYDCSSQQAQQILRQINNVEVIPRDIYNQILDQVEEYKNYKIENQEDREAFKKLRRKINQYTATIPHYKAKDGRTSKINEPGQRLGDVYVLNREYDFNEEDLSGQGILIDEELSNIIG